MRGVWVDRMGGKGSIKDVACVTIAWIIVWRMGVPPVPHDP